MQKRMRWGLGRSVGMGWELGRCVGDYGNKACSTWLELPFQRGEPETGMTAVE